MDEANNASNSLQIHLYPREMKLAIFQSLRLSAPSIRTRQFSSRADRRPANSANIRQPTRDNSKGELNRREETSELNACNQLKVAKILHDRPVDSRLRTIRRGEIEEEQNDNRGKEEK